MITVCIANNKGGVGKTTTTINLGAALADAGKRVLLVDLDPQASLTKSLGIDTAEWGDGAYNLFMGQPGKVEIVLLDIGRAGNHLSVIPTSNSLSLIPKELIDHINPNGVLRKALGPVTGRYDVVLLDTPPNLDRLTINALVASNYVIIPCQCQIMALLGLKDFSATLAKVQGVNERLEVLAVLPTMFTANRKVEQEALSILQNSYGELCRPPLPNRVEYLKASAEQRPVAGELALYWQELAEYVTGKAAL